MKIMRKIIGILAVLLLCTAFVGAGAAFTYSSNDAVVTPSGALTAGQTVSATMKITIAGDTFKDSNEIKLSTPLQGATWSTDIYKGKSTVADVNDYGYTTISGFMLSGPSDHVLVISVSGKVSAASEGKEISVMTITADVKETNGYYSYSTKKQKVYDKGNFANDVAALNTAITNLEKRSATYAGYGADVSAVNETIKQAQNKYSAAKSAGTGNLVTAYANIEAGETYAEKGERALALAGLNAASKNIGRINSIAVTLYDRGWDTEAQYLETKSISLTYTHEILSDTYKDGETPSAAKMDSFMGDVQKTLNQANEYLEDSKIPKFVKFIPIVIGVIVAVGAVVGIVFLIRRRRANSWDELG